MFESSYVYDHIAIDALNLPVAPQLCIRGIAVCSRLCTLGAGNYTDVDLHVLSLLPLYSRKLNTYYVYNNRQKFLLHYNFDNLNRTNP